MKWHKLITVIHKKNGGVSSARNEGIRNAVGKYVGFVDGDDYIEKDMYEELYKLFSVKDTIDMVSCGYFEDFTEKYEIKCCGQEAKLLDKEEAYVELFSRKSVLGCSCCNKLFKNEIICKNMYNESIKHCEDLDFLLHVLHQVREVICINKILYHYIHRENSATRKKFCGDQMGMVYVTENMINFTKENYSHLLPLAYAYQLPWLLNLLSLYYSSDKRKEYRNEKREIMRIVIKNKERYLKNRYVYWGDYFLLIGALMHLYKPFCYFLDIGVNLFHKLKSMLKI